MVQSRGTTPAAVLTALAVVCAAGWLGAQDPVPSEGEVRVVHYNLRNYLEMERRVGGEVVAKAPKPESEKAAVVKALTLAKPDVLGVCEMGSEQDLADLRERLQKNGLDLAHQVWVGAADAERHVALLSRFPVVAENSQKELSYRLDDKTLPFQRGILDVTLQLNPAYQLRLLGNHLKSRREVVEGDQVQMRRNEALLLRLHIEKILAENPGVNLLVYGDFNDTRNEATIKTIQGSFGSRDYLRDLILTDSDGYRWTYYWSFADIYDRIDFAFVSRGLFPEIVRQNSFILKWDDWLKASDHRPIIISIKPAESERRR